MKSNIKFYFIIFLCQRDVPGPGHRPGAPPPPLPPQVVGEGELEQRREDEGCTGAHPDVNGLSKRKEMNFKNRPGGLCEAVGLYLHLHV